jgi:hypothetical protein
MRPSELSESEYLDAAAFVILEGQTEKDMRDLFNRVFVAESFQEVQDGFKELEELTAKSVPEEFGGDLDAFMNSEAGKASIAKIGSEPENIVPLPKNVVPITK